MKWHIIKHPVLFSLCLSRLTSSVLGYEGGADESHLTRASLSVRHEPAVDFTGCMWVLMWYGILLFSIKPQWHPYNLSFNRWHSVLLLIFSSQYTLWGLLVIPIARDQAPWEQALLWKLNCVGNWKVFITGTEAHSSVYLNYKWMSEELF